jgi:hypothetical protein
MTKQTILAGAAALALTLGCAGSAAARPTSKSRHAVVIRSAQASTPVDLGWILGWLVPAPGEGSVPAIGIVTNLLDQLGLGG